MITSQQKLGGSLNDIQISLLRLFRQDMTESETLEVRKILMHHFKQNLQKELDLILKEKPYSEEDFHKMLSDDNFGIKKCE